MKPFFARSQGALRVGALAILASAAFSASAAVYDVSIDENGFSPSYLEVKVGDTVRWWNDDYVFYDPHSTRSYSYPWSSGPIDVGFGVALSASKIGVWDYTDDWGFSGWGTLVIKSSGPPPPLPATQISVPGRVDMVYDQGRDILYITSGSQVLRYQLATDSFLSPYQLSGSLMGIDISPDGNTLLVADSTADTNVWVHVIDLNSGQSRKANFPAASGESGTFAVAFGGDGAALITSRFAGSGWVPLRRYDPASGAVTTIRSVRHDSMVGSSGDGTSIIIAESDISGGGMELYDVASRSIVKTGGTGRFNYECAASKEASLFSVSTYSGSYVYNPTFGLVTNITPQPIAAAFHPAADVVFFPIAGTNLVKAYDTTTWQILGQYDFQYRFVNPSYYPFNNGRTRISPDGQVVFVTVGTGVAYIRHGLNVPLTHRLLVSGNPAPYGNPDPVGYGASWIADGTGLTVSVSPIVETNGRVFLCTGWTGTGSAAGTNSDPVASFNLTANSTLTFNWAPFALSSRIDSQPGGNQFVINWPSISGKYYDVLFSTNATGTFVPVAMDLPATPPNNTFQESMGATRAGFYKIQMK